MTVGYQAQRGLVPIGCWVSRELVPPGCWADEQLLTAEMLAQWDSGLCGMLDATRDLIPMLGCWTCGGLIPAGRMG